jgi:hypothetical protein
MKRAAVLVMLMLLPTAALAVNYTLVPENPVRIVPLNSQAELNVYLTNLEATDQDFLLIKSQQLPSENWQTSICVNGLCYAPFFDTIGVTVTAGDKDTVGAWISAYVDEGSGEAHLRVIPVNDPGNEKSQSFAGITDGVDVLIVDDDGGLSYESYYTGALPGGMIYGRWPRILDGPNAAELGMIGQVIWFTGEATPSLDAGDRTALTAYLNAGKKLLLSGQNIAYSLCDPGSPEYSAGAAAFVTDYLHATYGTNNSGTTSVVGDPMDPIGGGLSFSIAGGAGNQTSPDGVTPSSGDEALKYQSTAYSASVSSFASARRVVFFAFGLEGITSLSTRQTLIDRVLDYFTATVDVALADAGVPRPASLSANKPNPFNPSTRLSVVLDEARAASVSVFDASGRHVRTLAEGLFRAGETEVVWDGTDDSAAPVRSGVYFVRLNAGDREVTRKVSLIR